MSPVRPSHAAIFKRPNGVRRIALVAGHGRLPFIFADEARRDGVHVIGIAINGLTDGELESHVDRIYWRDITEPGKALEIFRQEKVNFVVMTGKIPKAVIFNRKFNLDKDVSEIMQKTVDSKDYTIIKAIAARLKKEGIHVMDPTFYFSKLLPPKGLLAKRPPTKEEWEDIRFGKKTAKKIAGMDIGQAVIVKKKMVIAVEAHEGTDEMIRRTGQLDGEGAVVIKVSRPHQDMRFDIPTIGPETVDSLIVVKAKVLAVEAKKTLVVDKDEIIKKADPAGISVVAI
ncbi:UDP-2,3-diacylglucosamine diphosphatase LpxI [Omnitrophica bacterium]|nr:UDP-2,3-diacylglucosamine diphosphatase LpxI [Candidatus Omnitrophota bacterium]